MKEFRKTKEGLFICEECKQAFIRKENLTKHINIKHINKKEYFDKWIKEKGDGICKTCGKETFLNRSKYREFCNTKCMGENRELNLIKKKTKLKKYGIENFVNIEKTKQTCLERYGDENYNNSKQNKKTKLERYGDENYNNRKKSKQTCLKKYGVEHILQNKKIFEKIKQTRVKKYGVEHILQNKKIFEKQQKTSFFSKRYKNTNINYRGSYELDFLEKYYNEIDISNGPSVKYKFNKKNKIYHSDFYIPSKNLIIEIKNSYLYKRDKLKIEAKEKATISNGFNYMIIINKNYFIFEKIL